MSQISSLKRYIVVDAPIGAVGELKADEAHFDIEAIFHAHYGRIARVIARVVRDPARAEELAVEVFVKLWRNRKAQEGNPEGWLYRVAVRMGLDELRRQTRRTRYEHMAGFFRKSPTPEEIYADTQEQERVRLILSIIKRRQAELLFLRSQGLSYEELSAALNVNPASIGTLLNRAQHIFRKEYNKRYGEQS
jgi:RNA polymerase sigma-70 factor (ECF subfamily)